MFVEEGFRVRFANGEVIDFYADRAEDKAAWMRALSEVVGREARSTRSWTGLVLARERQLAARAARHPPQPQPSAQQQQQHPANTFSTKSAPGTPATALRHHAPPAPQRAAVEGSASPKKSSFSRPMSQQQYHQQHQPAPQRHGLPPPAAAVAPRPNSSDKPLPPRGRNSGAGLMARHQKTRSMLF